MDLLSQYYKGFYIEKPLGNNAFSYQERKNKKIYVPALRKGSAAHLQKGGEVVFSEIEDGKEINAHGLENFIHLKQGNKDIVIFDNHNHAFFFWCWAVKNKRLKLGRTLLHIDQHKDMRRPEKFLASPDWATMDLKEAFEYTNFELNVGNFIPPAVEAGIFSKVEVWDNADAFEKDFPASYVLDLDMDVFAPAMGYIDQEMKFETIKEGIAGADFVTIATSPFFMDQSTAIKLIKELLVE